MAVNITKLTDVVLKITGTSSRGFGTAFAIHNDEQYVYLLTCRHVVDDVGGDVGLKANGIPVEVIAFDPHDGFDLAVLRVDKSRLAMLRLRLTADESGTGSFRTAGYFAYDKLTAGEEIQGFLKSEIVLRSDHCGKQIKAWNLEISGESQLQPGYSGAPVVNETGNIVAVINLMRGGGKQGLAITIEALIHIWPEMPPGLFGKKAVQISADLRNSDPLMNFKDEVAAFEQIVAVQNPNIKLIVLRGPSGSGKSRLLQEYKRLANANGRETLTFDLGPQITIEKCLDEIVDRLGISRFEGYRDFQRKGKPEPLTRNKEEEWQHNLTSEFFADLSRCGAISALMIFFDQYEKADQAFRKWLVDVFLPRLYQKSLIVIVAGQDELERTPTWEEKRHFILNGVSIDWYQRYAEECGVPLDFTEIKLLHDALKGLPAIFVTYIKGRQLEMERIR